MMRTLILTAIAVGVLSAATAFARADNINPLGLDAGPVHPAVPTQVTTYYPPRVAHHHHRMYR